MKGKVLAIIPARGGSKSIPNKNIKNLGGKPLIAYPIELAKSVSEIDRIIVSTDSEEIAKVAKDYGAETPFLRPGELSRDETPTLPTLQHAVKYMEDKEDFKADYILLLYPTCPFLDKESVIKALKVLEQDQVNSVISVSEDYGRYWSFNDQEEGYRPLYPKKRVNRQYYKPLYKENGAIYFSKYDVIINQEKLVDEDNTEFIVMDNKKMIDIDTPEDWINAEKSITGGDNGN